MNYSISKNNIHKMENRTQINCSCSLINIRLKIDQPLNNNEVNYIQQSPVRIQTRQNIRSNHSNHSIKKQKISLSKSNSIHSKQKKQRQSLHSNQISTLNQSITNKFARTSFDSKISQNKVKKKYINVTKMIQHHTKTQKQNNDLEKTKNTQFDSSFQRVNRVFTSKKRITQNLPFSHQMKKIQQERLQKYEKYERPYAHIRQETKKTSIYQSQNLNYSNPFSNQISQKQKGNNFNNQQMRKIRTLRQLQCRDVQSSGKMTSQNHTSMVVSSDSDLNDLQGLGGILLNKSASVGFHMAKTQKLMY